MGREKYTFGGRARSTIIALGKAVSRFKEMDHELRVNEMPTFTKDDTEREVLKMVEFHIHELLAQRT